MTDTFEYGSDDIVSALEADDKSNGVSKDSQVSENSVDTVVMRDMTIKVMKKREDSEVNGHHPIEQYELMIKKSGTVDEGADGPENPPTISTALELSCQCNKKSTFIGYTVMFVMLLSNIVNYMDRYTIAGGVW